MVILGLLMWITVIKAGVRRETEFGVRINLIEFLEIEKITDVDFGEVVISDLAQNMKSSGTFKVTGYGNTRVRFTVSQTQQLTNGDHTIPMKTHVSDVEDGGEKQTADLSNEGEFYGYLVAELGSVQGAQLGEYIGRVKLEVNYD